MEKLYLNKSVLQAFNERMDIIFSEFENIFVSFSGGKDSGVLLNLVLKYMQEHDIKKRIGLFHVDFEAQYKKTTEYVERTFASNLDRVEPYWVCLPLAARNAASNFETYWYTWDDEKPDIWVREMPKFPYVINMDNNPITTYEYKEHEKVFSRRFGRWYKDAHGGGKTICLLGLRSDESLRRYSGIVNKRYPYKGEKWITSEFKDVWSASPLYDWSVDDIWTANGRFDFDYNHLYDLFYKAGLTLDQMRVASPFIEYSVNTLNLYRVIEPETWCKIVGRVQGANFAAIYGTSKAMGYHSVSLPAGHTWESYTKFLLETLPEELRNKYLEKFNFSMEFWEKTGGGFSEETIKEVESCGYKIKRNGVSNYSKDKKSRIVFEQEIPDDTDNVTSTNDLPSWKRMCYCILKNDHNCMFMGFGPTKQQQEKITLIKDKYKSFARGN
ncbi:MAG: DUF3440 domain-containing protein [Oscillospiraceae bacterium]